MSPNRSRPAGNRAASDYGSGSDLVAFTVTPTTDTVLPVVSKRRPPQRAKASRSTPVRLTTAWCTPPCTWTAQGANALAIASVHSATFGHMVAVESVVTLTFTGSAPTRKRPGRNSTKAVGG